ncbi:hypothetical protein [Jeotgalibacillus sp. R-1-5s-1]|uniref:hypothetical protein n=1 Tax=Jeotgalibacillus sp. R-1-5s-1 TaxID=2555897 RepID=UPI00106986C2|nr:hypothetical protein [Jeotgalibacillus sp. R-1-5s-1]TFE01838.1 hypothetical protein E2491_03445 [Jeotgalibacillus sp. R-1-5s-1]
MKLWINRISSLLTLASLTLVFVMFFFPGSTPFSIPFLFVLFGLFLIVSIVTFDPAISKRDELTGLPVTIYFAALVIFLQLIGGETETPLSIDQPFLWIAIVIGIWLDFKRNRKRKTETNA